MNNKNPFDVKGIAVTTPKGKALWCKNVTPDTKFDEKGELSISLILDPNDQATIDFLAPLEAMLDEAFKQTVKTLGPVKGKTIDKNPIAKTDTDKDGNDTGMIKIKLKLGKIKDRQAEGKPHTIKTVDAKKAEIKHPPMVGNGSTVRCAGFAFPYYAAALRKVGVSIMWNSLQIIDPVQAGGGDEFGEEDGYVAGAESVTDFDSVPF